jgi:O-antigen biosynthesis protein WbqP
MENGNIRANLELQSSTGTAIVKKSGIALALKRITDVVLSAIAIALLAPLLVLVALAIVIDSPGSPIFKQRRVGKNGKLFEIYKFRTMFVGSPNVATELMLKMERNPITRVGQVLRKTSIDELPQLLNVLIGNMSLVGPRPALFNQYELTEKRQLAGALSMPPGITGWAQVNGRDDLSDDAKVELDAWYCRQWYYFLDWKIISRTFTEVILRRGAV